MRYFTIISLLLLLISSSVQADEMENGGSPDPMMYGEVELGTGFFLRPRWSIKKNYKDAPYDLSLRAAASVSYNRFRLEYGIENRRFEDGKLKVNNYNGISVGKARGEIDMTQREFLLLWLKYQHHRISFIGGGPVTLDTDEKMKLTYSGSAGGGKETIKGTDTARGFKLVVGGKDVGSHVKTAFSYQSVRVSSISGKSFDMGGYTFTVSLSFGGP